MNNNYIHINKPSGYYLAQVRGYGKKNWRDIGCRYKSSKSCMIAAIKNMGINDKHARILFIAEYYDPILIAEIKNA